MKKQLLSLILLGLLIIGCKKDNTDTDSLTRVEGLSLYWDHEVFGEGGRRLRFEFYETKEFENSFELVFDHTVEGKDIIITLVDRIDKGKCQQFPTADGIDSLCTPRGGLFIQDRFLENGSYSFILKTYDFEIISSLLIDDEKYVLDIPSNENFSSSIKEVFPIPEDLLFGRLVFQGVENTQSANEYFDALESIGLVATRVPNYPYRHLDVDDSGRPVDSHWEPDNHSLGFLYNMGIPFKDVFELSKEHFNKTNLNISLYSSKGDQARLSQNDGIIVEYAE